MSGRRWTALAVSVAGITALVVPQHLTTVVWNPYARAALVALALFWFPGLLLSHSTGIGKGRSPAERFSLTFVTSLGLLIPALSAPLFLATSISAFVPAYMATMVALAAAAMLSPLRGNERTRPAEESAGPLVLALVAVAVVVLTGAAWHLTKTGSVDRWWYLAYIRSYMDAAVVTLSEPFMGSGHMPPRFGFNSWLLTLAVWAKQAAVDPIWLYERATAAGLVPLAFSALLLLARSLFGNSRTAWLTVLSGGLLWMGGSMFPIVTRIPEDKLFAMMVVAPVATAVFVARMTGGWRRWVAAFGLSVAVLATTHGLIYAIVLLVTLPFGALMVWSGRTQRAKALVLVAVLAAGAVYPAWSGVAVHSQLAADVADLDNRDHPVVRVHWSRGRLVEVGGGMYMVRPQLLLHPVVILGLLSLPAVMRRRPVERFFLLPATLAPLALAFIPPLATMAGAVLLPWMVYRLLWALPIPMLVAVAVDAGGRVAGKSRWIPVLLLVSLAMPWSVKVMGGRFSPERSDLVMPGPGAFRAMMKRVGRLDTNAVVAASAEISERIPAVTGRRVLAISDRGTIVFSGSRELAEKRLRSRAAVLSGRWQALEEVPRPTHILFEPGTAAALYCAEEVYTLPGFQLCSFDSTPLIEGSELKEAPPATDGPVAVSLEKMLFDQQALLRAECTPPLDEEARFLHWPRPGPWSARFADSLCTIRSRLGSAQALFKPRTLRLTPFLGHAVEELSLSVVGSRNGSQQWRADKTTRVHSGEELRFELPADAVDTVRINVVPNFLPFLKLKDLSLTIEPSAEPVP